MSRKTRRAQKAQVSAKTAVTHSYTPILVHHWGVRPRDLPLFTFLSVQAMLYDPTIRLGLAMRAAPIYQTEFGYKDDKGTWTPGVQAKNEAVGEFVYRQLKKIWELNINVLVKSQIWGHCGGEVMLKLTDDNMVEVDKLLERHPNDLRVLKRMGQSVGIRISRLTQDNQGHADLFFRQGKGYWTTFNAEAGAFYGTSILLGAYSPWFDKWCDGGALDTRRLFMHKDAYVGGTLYYPEGDLYEMPDGSVVPARDLARQFVEQIVAGGVMALPSTTDDKGKEKWVFKPATVASNPGHILKYPQDLDTEMLRGIEVPDDIFTADSQSSGAWAGKKVPLSAFYAGLDCWIVQLIKDVTKCILEPLVLMNFGSAEDFLITHKPLAEQAMDQQKGGQQQPPGPPPGGPPGMPPGMPGAPPDQAGAGAPDAGGSSGLADLFGGAAADQARGGGAPQAMSLEAAIGRGVLDAAEIVKASRETLDAAMVRMAGAASPWTAFRGPKGGQGWKNSTTGEVVYQREQPGTRGPAQPQVPGPGRQPAAQAAAAAPRQPAAAKPGATAGAGATVAKSSPSAPADKPPTAGVVDKNGIGYGVKGGWPWSKPAMTGGDILKAFPPANEHGDDTQVRYKTADGKYTPQRQQLHQKILADIFQGKQPVPAGEQAICIFLGGGTAAGKSTALRSGGIQIPDGAVHVDADEIKNVLPEFQTLAEQHKYGAAGVIHEESSDLSKDVVSKATSGRYHTVIDGTGDTSINSIATKTKKARDAGHKIIAHYCTNDMETAMRNAIGRASKPPYRMVEAEIATSIHAGVSQLFPQAVAAGLFDEVSLWDTDVEKGKPPILVASGKGKDLQIHDQGAWKKFQDKANLMETHKHLWQGEQANKEKPATVHDVFMALETDGPQMKMEDRMRILKEVTLGRRPQSPDNEEMAAFRERMQAEAEKMKAAGQIMDIPSDWPEADAGDSKSGGEGLTGLFSGPSAATPPVV